MGVEAEVVAVLTQMGAAGLIGLMWLVERRSSSERERKMAALQERILSDKEELGVLLTALDSNTRAMVSLENGQRRLIEIVESLERGRERAEGSPRAGRVRA